MRRRRRMCSSRTATKGVRLASGMILAERRLDAFTLARITLRGVGVLQERQSRREAVREPGPTKRSGGLTVSDEGETEHD